MSYKYEFKQVGCYYSLIIVRYTKEYSEEYESIIDGLISD